MNKGYIDTVVVYADAEVSETTLSLNAFKDIQDSDIEKMMFDKMNYIENYSSIDTVYYYILHYKLDENGKKLIKRISRDLNSDEGLKVEEF